MVQESGEGRRRAQGNRKGIRRRYKHKDSGRRKRLLRLVDEVHRRLHGQRMFRATVADKVGQLLVGVRAGVVDDRRWARGCHAEASVLEELPSHGGKRNLEDRLGRCVAETQTHRNFARGRVALGIVREQRVSVQRRGRDEDTVACLHLDLGAVGIRQHDRPQRKLGLGRRNAADAVGLHEAAAHGVHRVRIRLLGERVHGRELLGVLLEQEPLENLHHHQRVGGRERDHHVETVADELVVGLARGQKRVVELLGHLAGGNVARATERVRDVLDEREDGGQDAVDRVQARPDEVLEATLARLGLLLELPRLVALEVKRAVHGKGERFGEHEEELLRRHAEMQAVGARRRQSKQGRGELRRDRVDDVEKVDNALATRRSERNAACLHERVRVDAVELAHDALPARDRLERRRHQALVVRHGRERDEEGGVDEKVAAGRVRFDRMPATRRSRVRGVVVLEHALLLEHLNRLGRDAEGIERIDRVVRELPRQRRHDQLAHKAVRAWLRGSAVLVATAGQVRRRKVVGVEAVASGERSGVTQDSARDRVARAETAAGDARLGLLGHETWVELEIVNVAVEHLGSLVHLGIRVPLAEGRVGLEAEEVAELVHGAERPVLARRDLAEDLDGTEPAGMAACAEGGSHVRDGVLDDLSQDGIAELALGIPLPVVQVPLARIGVGELGLDLGGGLDKLLGRDLFRLPAREFRREEVVHPLFVHLGYGRVPAVEHREFGGDRVADAPLHLADAGDVADDLERIDVPFRVVGVEDDGDVVAEDDVEEEAAVDEAGNAEELFVERLSLEIVESVTFIDLVQTLGNEVVASTEHDGEGRRRRGHHDEAPVANGVGLEEAHGAGSHSTLLFLIGTVEHLQIQGADAAGVRLEGVAREQQIVDGARIGEVDGLGLRALDVARVGLVRSAELRILDVVVRAVGPTETVLGAHEGIGRMRQVAPDDGDERIREGAADVGCDGHAGEERDELLEKHLAVVEAAARQARDEEVGRLAEQLDVVHDSAAVELVEQRLELVHRRVCNGGGRCLRLLKRHLRLLARLGGGEAGGIRRLMHLVLDKGFDLQ
ncbi:hypothetical protein L1887_59916 [Cichorium endivia]|nr:hypothetical protein L1887_59916 [Cichorium endivia]